MSPADNPSYCKTYQFYEVLRTEKDLLMGEVCLFLVYNAT
jgi:hypothetical protein